jgi:SAM-dependent methyltransferase
VIVDVAPFETWSPDMAPFDLLCSGSAWHWIDPVIGVSKAASLLRPGGQLCVFWNVAHYDDAIEDVLHRVFDQHAPGVWIASRALGATPVEPAELAAVRASGMFDAPEQRVFTHEVVCTVEQWIDEARTHSPIALLPADVSSRLFIDVTSALAGIAGEQLTVRYDTRATSATRQV